MKLVDSSTVNGQWTSRGRGVYHAEGVLETKQTTINAVRNAELVRDMVTDSQTVWNTPSARIVSDSGWYDPLAQSFLIENKGGMIVNIGSFYDKLGVKQHLTYCATKAAIGAMTRCMAVEWASKGIRVLNVAPGFVMTDFNREMIQKGPLAEYLAKRIPSGVPGEAQDIGNLVTSLFVLNSPYMTGETIYIDGAHGMLQ